MKFTKDNIIGLQFKCKVDSYPIIYTISTHSEYKIEVNWGKKKTTYNIEEVLEYLNDGGWECINKLEPTYEIY